MTEDQANEMQLREKFRHVDVYMAPKISQYWRAPVGLAEVQSTPADGAAFLESDYAGDLRIYIRKGYDKEVYPYELAEQLQSFFNVPVEHKDLLTVALIAPEDRVDHLFETRGIAPLLEDDTADEEHGDNGAAYAPVRYCPQPNKKSWSQYVDDSRFSRLFGHKRFNNSFSGETVSSSSTPPSYSVAVARATQNAIGRPAEPRTFGGAIMLSALKASPNKLDFVQERGAVVGLPKRPPTIFERIRGLVQSDGDVGEKIVRLPYDEMSFLFKSIC